MRRFTRLLISLLVISGLAVGCARKGGDVEIGAVTQGTTPGSTIVETTTTTAPACATWVRVDSDKTGNRWFTNGVPSIAAASTPEEARAAAHDWLAGVRTDPILMKGAVKYTLDVDVTVEELFDPAGCATAKAVDLNAQMEAALALSAIMPEEAPADGYNSGTEGDSVVAAAQPGIGGDRKAVKIQPPGEKEPIWVMARCGNLVTIVVPSVPPGKTDNPLPGVGGPTTTVPTTGGKDHRRSPVSNDPNDPDERVRPNVPAPSIVIRPEPQPGVTTTTQPAPPVTVTTPTTEAPAPPPPVTSPPTTNPPPPPPGSF